MCEFVSNQRSRQSVFSDMRWLGRVSSDLRIGIFTDLFHPRTIGGGENRLLNLAYRLANMGNEIHVITSRVPNRPDFERMNPGIHIHRIGRPHPPSGTSVLISLVYLLSGIWHLKKLLNLRLQVLESNTYIPSYLAAILSLISGIPHVMTVHDVYLMDWKHRLGLPLLPFAILLEIGLRHLRPTITVTVSNSSKQKLVRQLGFAGPDIEVIPNAVPFEQISSLPSEETQFSVVYLGRLVAHKHVDHALMALKSLKQIRNTANMLIVGIGPEKENLEEMSVTLGLRESVKFTGFVQSQARIYQFLKQSRILINPSTVEGFGIVLLEAMAAGIPPIVYDIPAYRDFIKNEVNAIVVERENVEELASALVRLAQDEILWNRLSKGALHTASLYSWERISKCVLTTYCKALMSG